MNPGAFMASGIALDSSHMSGVTHEDVQSMVTQQIQQLLATLLNAQPSSPTTMSASSASAHSMNHSGKTSSWIFDSGASHHMTHDSSILVERSTSFTPSSIQTTDGSSMELWHSRLGHVSGSRLKYTVSNGLLGDILYCDVSNCKGCKLRKFNALPFRKSTSVSCVPLDLIHSDVSGPSPVRIRDSSPEIVVPDEVFSSPLPFPSDTPSLPESIADPDDARPSPSQVAPRILLLIYVNDIITGDDSYGISKLKDHLYDKFEMKDLGLLRYFPCIEVAYSPKGYLLSQTKYANDILSRAKLTEVKVVDTPLEFNVKLCPMMVLLCMILPCIARSLDPWYILPSPDLILLMQSMWLVNLFRLLAQFISQLLFVSCGILMAHCPKVCSSLLLRILL
ncbi:hypothetical protein RJ639_010686 [Escallonia herrerae]|uniref:Mitochondrial protein n=1 Tax=Escallonia herrerae TaxID=1293975 RepID=A0AA88VQ37_9ASTE|nr:hypothetical protein RJ639_010686 [Escallonia herrerae]